MKKVSILGRSNVGKSSLFNILLSKKDAIVSSKENMTRDIKRGIINYKDVQYTLSDMGGLTDGKGLFLDLINEKIKQEVEQSDLTIVLFNIRHVIDDDREVVQFARKHFNRLIFVANQADTEEIELNLIENIYKIGIDDYLTISCKNFRNLNHLRLKIYNILKDIPEIKKEKTIGHKKIVVSILGKPNVGKSSLLNSFLGEDRAIVSDMSGTTRDSVDGFFDYENKRIHIIDTAGVRRKNRDKEEEEEKSLKRSIRSIEESDIVLLMIDAKENISMQDKKIAQTIKARYKPIIFVINKWDLSPYSWEEYKKYLYYEFRLLKEWEMIPISVFKNQGIEKLKRLILKIYRSSRVAFRKEELQKVIRDALHEQQPARVEGKRLQVFQYKQISRAPIVIEFIVNDTQLIKKNYIKYLSNAVKNHFNLQTIDVKMVFRDKK